MNTALTLPDAGCKTVMSPTENPLTLGLWMVPMPVARAMPTPPEGLDRLTRNVLSGAKDVVPKTGTVMSCSVTPGANVKLPDWAV